MPRIVSVGVGCKRGTDPAVLETRVRGLFAEKGIALEAVREVASIDLKRDEPAVLGLGESLGCPVRFYSAGELNAVEGEFSGSGFVRETVGTDNVCERAAVASGGRLIVRKQAGEGVTVALAVDDLGLEPPEGLVLAHADVPADRAGDPEPASSGARAGKLSVVGLGPGAGGDLTLRAREALEECDAIVGYTAYVALVEGDFPGKTVISTGMRHETERCEMALERAASGDRVALVCSGDPGVYGMAGLCLELSERYPGVELEIVPGVTAANGGAAVLGSPLGHDFAVVSLSDLLTPWETIERRLRRAAEADFCICLYNPSSRKRSGYLSRACDVLLESKSPDTLCGSVRNIGREGEEAHVMTLSELRDTHVDMFTTVFVGSTSTRLVGRKMVTPRGYLQRRRGTEEDGGDKR